MEKEHIVGRRLREYRGNRTQAEMAALLDITPNYYGEMERGKKLPSFDMIQNFIAATGKDANYWFGIDTDTPSSVAAKDEDKTSQRDITTIISLLQKLSDERGFSEYLSKTINKNTTIPQIIAVIAQLRAYLSELEPDALPESDARTISDLLAACQRVINAIEIDEDETAPITVDCSHHPRQETQATAKIIQDCYRH